jgi:hypothetical protein
MGHHLAVRSRHVGPGRYPFLRIRSGEVGDATVELGLWNAEQERVDDFPG